MGKVSHAVREFQEVEPLDRIEEQIVIKLLDVKPQAPHMLELLFSGQTHGIFDGADYLGSRKGPLLEALRDPTYFSRCFVDAGALCWPNGLELSAARLQKLSRSVEI